jgi:hypothetical protein
MVRRIAFASAAAWCLTSPAFAEADLFSPSAFSGQIDVRVAAAKGARSWLERGFGKTRYSGGKDSFVADGAISGDLVWQPRFNWNTKAVVDLSIQPSQKRALEANEAYLSYKTGPGAWGFAGRLGYFYPAISLEHEGATWATIDTITPSAINSWAGEEVKVVGAEATAQRRFDTHQISGTVGAFGNGDTAGTLLTFRGWGFHDVRSSYKSVLPLPPLSPFMSRRQDPFTEPSLEVDERIGYYARGEYQPSQSSTFHVFYYDNNGDRTGVTRKQWAWDTRFVEAGARFWLDADTKITAQAMTGTTAFGFNVPPRGIWSDVDFSSAFASVTHRLGGDRATLRADWFEVKDKVVPLDNNNERGWARTGAYRHKLTEYAQLMGEALYVDSARPSRALAALPTKLGETTFQASLRVSF